MKEEALHDYKTMTAQQLAESLDRIPLIKAWISGVEDMSKEMLLNGDEVPTYKVVEGRKSRTWKDEEAVIRYLSKGVKAFKKTCFEEPKFKSVARIEKALKTAEFNRKVDLERFIQVNRGKPTVVPESDKREAIRQEDAAAKDFEEFA
jgi:hypothetical protein